MRTVKDYPTREAAMARSAELLQATARSWRPAGVAQDGLVYLAGDWPRRAVGRGRHSRPELGICTHAVPVMEGAGRLAGRFLVEDETGTEVADDEIKRADVIDAEPARTR